MSAHSQKEDMIQTFLNGSMVNLWKHSYHGIQLGNKKDKINNKHNNLDDSPEYDAE